MCRSRRELSNEYLLAKIGVDTAENEPLEEFEGKYSILLNRVLSYVSEREDGPSFQTAHLQKRELLGESAVLRSRLRTGSLSALPVSS